MLPPSSDAESASPAAPEPPRPPPYAPLPPPPPHWQPAPAAAASTGGIGRAFLRPSSPQLPRPPPPPPAQNLYFPSPGSHPAHHQGGGINVHNIFASMHVGDEGHGHAHSNNMFHNFAAGNAGIVAGNAGIAAGIAAAAGRGGGATLPFRKYSDCTNQRSGTIPANGGNAAAAASPPRAANGMSRSGSGTFSKSMGTSAAFLTRGHRNMSECEYETSHAIRHTGYLLKRSNLPYEPSPVAAATMLDDVIAGIAPLPDLRPVQGDADAFNLPFGGLDDATASLGTASDDVSTPRGPRIEHNNHAFRPVVGPGPAGLISVTTEDTAEADVPPAVAEAEPCFCSPAVQYFEKLFRSQGRSNALATAAKGQNQGRHPMEHAEGRGAPASPQKTPRSPRPPASPRPTTRPLPIKPTPMSPTVNRDHRYSMPLKSPARSEPVPISPPPRGRETSHDATASASRGGDFGGHGGSHVSKSLSNKGAMTTASTDPTAATSDTAAPQREHYLPPPPNFIDPRDGHIWRAKYCVLEEGILYFYRTAAEGESAAAQRERSEARAYSADFSEGEDIFLGEVYVTDVSPGRTASARAGSTRQRAEIENRMSSRDLYDLSKSPMPTRKADLLDFARSPFHRSGSSVLTSAGSDSRRGSSETIPEDAGRSTPTRSMRHSGSTGTFQDDAEVLWEKRVALDCVGAVRSSTQEHGVNSFELLAYGAAATAGRGEGDGRTDVGAQEVIDRLVLRAGTSDDMNAWMFQFHRSLTSYMRQVVNSAGTARRKDHRVGLSRPDSPSTVHRRLQPSASVDQGGCLSPFVTTQQSFATSPTTTNNSLGGGSYVGSLSHGHGRNALYRRKIRDHNSSSHAGSNNEAVISPLPTPIGTPVGGSSPVDKFTLASAPNHGILAQKKQSSLVPTTMVPSGSSNSRHVDLTSLRDSRGGAKEDVPSAAAAPQKYIPPHARNATPKKWIPPHMRRKLAEAASRNNGADAGTTHDAHKPAPSNVATKEIEHAGVCHAAGSAAEAPGESLADAELSAASLSTTTSSLLSRQLKDTLEGGVIPPSIYVRLGGCADPTAVAGSILDRQFVPRKASVVGTARLEAYGGAGGGSFAPFDGRRSSLRAEESAPLSCRSEATDGPDHRSVLRWEAGASSECGVRNSNEDSYVAIGDLEGLIRSQGLVPFSEQDLGRTKQQGLYAIFDGHVGNQAARFSAERFHEMLIEEQSSLASRDSACLSSIEERADFILHRAFDRLDKDFCSLCTTDGRDWDCGSTALVALITDDVVSLANLGDCQGVVCRLVSNDSETDDGWEVLDPPGSQDEDLPWGRTNGGGVGSNARESAGKKLLWKEVTETHSPLHDEERARIEKANGWILKETEIPIGQLHRMDIFDEDVVEIVKRCFADRMKHHRCDPVRLLQIARTCGDLAVSRAIGDRDFKAAYNDPSSPDTAAAAASGSRTAVERTAAEERKEDLARSWQGPPVFLYPDDHSGRFRGDLVSSVPDVRSFRVGREGVVDNEFLLMACDGLWDVMDGDDAVRIAKHLLFDKKLSAKDGAARLAELAQHLGSSDNITVILIRFYWEEEKCEE